MNNRLYNCKNPNQGTAKKVLCVCSAGLLRSPTTANVLAARFGYNTRSAGSTVTYALIKVDEVLLHWADEVVFVNKENFVEVLFNFPELDSDIKLKANVLDVPDNFEYMDPALQKIIFEQYTKPKEINGKHTTSSIPT